MAKGQTISGIVNSYYRVSAINTASNTVSLNSSSGLSIGTKVLIIQMKGAAINTSQTTTAYGDISNPGSAGNYEFNYICSISGNDVLLRYQLLRSYDATQQVQLISIPVYGSVVIADTLKSSAWDPATGTGGIVAIEATDTVYLNSGIAVNAQGFEGGALVNYPVPPYNCSAAVNVTDYYLPLPNPITTANAYQTGGMKGEGIAAYISNEEYGRGKLANGGGGGNNTNTGGAGGGNYGAGGSGGKRTNESLFKCHGQNPGVGGISLSAYGYSTAQNRIFFGGGGGSGHENNDVGLPGGNGGGIVIISCRVLMGTGTSICANGADPVNPSKSDPAEADGDGGGGGGAGGTIILNSTLVQGNISVQAYGGRGSNASNNVPDCTGPGGGGGGGVIWVAGSTIPSSLTTSVSGGSSGVVSATSGTTACIGSANGATAGANGNVQTGYTAPLSTSPACTILAQPALNDFRGTLAADGATLYWTMNSPDDIADYLLERSADLVRFTTIASISNDGQKEMMFHDPFKAEGTLYYRLILVQKDAAQFYSPLVRLTRYDDFPAGIISLRPNPVYDQVHIVLFSKKAERITAMVYDAYGRRIVTAGYFVNAGYTPLDIPFNGFSDGVYFLSVQGNSVQAIKRFIKGGR